MKQSIIAAWISFPVVCAASAGVPGDTWICQKANLTRHVVVFYPAAPNPVPCKVFYAKPNENVIPRPLWEASNKEGYCERKAAGFVRKLESWGWRCIYDETEQPADN